LATSSTSSALNSGAIEYLFDIHQPPQHVRGPDKDVTRTKDVDASSRIHVGSSSPKVAGILSPSPRVAGMLSPSKKEMVAVSSVMDVLHSPTVTFPSVLDSKTVHSDNISALVHTVQLTTERHTKAMDALIALTARQHESMHMMAEQMAKTNQRILDTMPSTTTAATPPSKRPRIDLTSAPSPASSPASGVHAEIVGFMVFLMMYGLLLDFLIPCLDGVVLITSIWINSLKSIKKCIMFNSKLSIANLTDRLNLLFTNTICHHHENITQCEKYAPYSCLSKFKKVHISVLVAVLKSLSFSCLDVQNVRYIGWDDFLQGLAQVVAEPTFKGIYHAMAQKKGIFNTALNVKNYRIPIMSATHRQSIVTMIRHPYYLNGFRMWLEDPDNFEQHVRQQTQQPLLLDVAQPSTAPPSTLAAKDSLLAHVESTISKVLIVSDFLCLDKFKDNENENIDEIPKRSQRQGDEDDEE
jgi:hypothetical protein